MSHSAPGRRGNTVSSWTKIQNKENSLSLPAKHLHGCYPGRTGSATSSHSWLRSIPAPSSPPWACPRKRSTLRGKTCSAKGQSADLIVRNASDTAIALLEIKASAAQHGDQFDRYDNWAKAQPQPPACYLIALDGEALNPPEDWKAAPTCPQLLGCWRGSRDPHTAWLAAAAGVLEGWVVQADGKLGNAAGPIVGDLVARKIAAALLADANPRPGFGAYPERDFGGAAMVVAYLPFPGRPQATGPWLYADLRSKFRNRPEAPWHLRLGSRSQDQ